VFSQSTVDVLCNLFACVNTLGNHLMCWYTQACRCDVVDVAGAWLETLLDVIELLPKDVIKKDVSEAVFGRRVAFS